MLFEGGSSSLAAQMQANELLQELSFEFQKTKEAIIAAGYPLTSQARPQSLDHMLKLTADEARRLCFQLRLTRILSSNHPEILEEPTACQKRLLKRALDFFGLEISESAMTHIGPDDIIEVYDENSTQLYRSLNFFKTSGYSLEDLLMNEWYVLWERPQSIINKLMYVMQSILKGEKEIIPFDVPKHIVREVFQNGLCLEMQRLLNVEIKLGIAVRRKGSQKISALVVTSACSPVSDEAGARGIRFL